MHHFWLDFNPSLTFWRMLYLKKTYIPFIPIILNNSNENSSHFCRPAIPKTLAGCSISCHIELWWWVWLELNNSFTFWNKLFLKKFIPFITFILIINQRNPIFFPRQATAKRFSHLKFTKMVRLLRQFWLDLNISLTFSSRLYLIKTLSLICNF